MNSVNLSTRSSPAHTHRSCVDRAFYCSSTLSRILASTRLISEVAINYRVVQNNGRLTWFPFIQVSQQINDLKRVKIIPEMLFKILKRLQTCKLKP